MNNYGAWNISEWDYPQNGKLEDRLKYFSRYGLLAANLHNSQPWKFRIKGNILQIIPDLKYHLKEIDPNKKYLFISLGCCIKNIECIAAYHGYKTLIKLISDTNIILSLYEGQKDRQLANLAPYITKRFSNKLAYSKTPVSRRHVENLKKIWLPSCLKLKFIDDKEIIQKTAALHKQAIEEEIHDKRAIKELTHWLRSSDTKLDDGMPGFVAGLDDIQSKVGIFLLKLSPSFAEIQAKAEKKLLSESPLMCILVGNGETYKDWIDIGRVYEELALRAFSQGVYITPHQAVIANRKTFKKVSELIDIQSETPQMLFRLGYSSYPSYHTPRRTIERCIDTEYDLAAKIKVDNLEMKQEKIDRYLINYIKAGNGKPLLLIHGGNLGWGQWYPNIEELAKFYTLYAIDLPGGGRSTRIDFESISFEKDFVDIVEKFIQKLNLSYVNIIGSSLGGWIALKLSLRKKIKIKKIVIVDSLGLNKERVISERIIGVYPLAKLLTKTVLKPDRSNLNLEKFMRDVFFDPNILLRREFVDYFYETSETSHNLLLISRLSKGTNKLLLTNELLALNNEVLVVWGKEDKLIPFSKVKDALALIPRLKVRLFKDCGHIPSIEKSEEFNGLVLNFLKSKT